MPPYPVKYCRVSAREIRIQFPSYATIVPRSGGEGRWRSGDGSMAWVVERLEPWPAIPLARAAGRLASAPISVVADQPRIISPCRWKAAGGRDSIIRFERCRWQGSADSGRRGGQAGRSQSNPERTFGRLSDSRATSTERLYAASPTMAATRRRESPWLFWRHQQAVPCARPGRQASQPWEFRHLLQTPNPAMSPQTQPRRQSQSRVSVTQLNRVVGQAYHAELRLPLPTDRRIRLTQCYLTQPQRWHGARL